MKCLVAAIPLVLATGFAAHASCAGRALNGTFEPAGGGGWFARIDFDQGRAVQSQRNGERLERQVSDHACTADSLTFTLKPAGAEAPVFECKGTLQGDRADGACTGPGGAKERFTGVLVSTR